MALSPAQITQLKTEALGIDIESGAEPISDFFRRTLGLTPHEYQTAFDTNTFALVVGELTSQREDYLEIKLQIPTYVIYSNALGITTISGLLDFLAIKGVSPVTRDRLSRHAAIRRSIRLIRKNHDFEVLAAAIMESLWDYGEATRGSGDQGVDSIGLRQLSSINIALKSGDIASSLPFPGEHIFIFASSKVTISTKSGSTKVIQPAHIRELIGGWILQRSEMSVWKEFNVKMLSPLQMVLVTTYRLSNDSKALCRDIGIEVWGLPQLIYLICLAAPDSVFLPGGNFNGTAFGNWWRKKRNSRIHPTGS